MSNELGLAVRALRRCELSETGITIPAGLPFSEYEKIGAALGAINRASRWALGDWIIYGEETFGEKYAQAIDATGLSYGYLRNIVSTCRRVPPSRRREGVHFSVHAEVAALEPREQSRWLRVAEKEQLTSEDLRYKIREEHGLLDGPSSGAATRDRQTGSASVATLVPATGAIGERTASGLPTAYVVPGAVVRRLVRDALPGKDGYMRVPRDLIERLSNVLDDNEREAA